MSQCSERVKHALSPPFVSSGLFSSPRRRQEPAALSAYSPPAPGNRAQQPDRGDLARKTASRTASASHRLPAPPRPAHRMQAGGETGNIYAATLTIYIARPAVHIAGLPGAAPDQRLRGFRTLPRPLSGHPSRLRTAEAPATTKSTQIGHKLCMNRRNRPVLPACIAMRA